MLAHQHGQPAQFARQRLQTSFFFDGKVSVCDNLAFSGEHVIKRKHSANLKRDLASLIDKIVEHLAIQWESRKSCIDCYYKTDVTEASADHEIMEVHRRDVIGI